MPNIFDPNNRRNAGRFSEDLPGGRLAETIQAQEMPQDVAVDPYDEFIPAELDPAPSPAAGSAVWEAWRRREALRQQVAADAQRQMQDAARPFVPILGTINRLLNRR